MENNDEEKTIDGKFEMAPMEAITRAEVDIQIATARQYPRKMSEFNKRTEAMACQDQETAESCLYQLRRKDRESPGGYKIIEGESIRLAEIVAACFGNLRSAVQITSQTPVQVKVRAVCHDLETNNLIAVEKVARTTYKDGSPYNEDMAIVATNAVVSKALRDAIFRVVPKALVRGLKEKVKQVAFGDGQAFAERRKNALIWANQVKGVSLDRVFAVLGVKGEEDITVDHLAILAGLKNAIKEGDQSLDEAFPPLVQGEALGGGTFVKPAANPKQEEKKPEPPKTEPAKAAPKTKAPPKTEAPKTEPAPTTAAPAPEPPKEAPSVVTPAPEQTTTAASGPEHPTTAEDKAADEAAEADAGLAPQTTTAAAPAAPAPGAGSSQHTEFQELMENAGITFEEFMGWAWKGMIPASTNPKPSNWNEIPEEKVPALIKSFNAVKATILKKRNSK